MKTRIAAQMFALFVVYSRGSIDVVEEGAIEIETNAVQSNATFINIGGLFDMSAPQLNKSFLLDGIMQAEAFRYAVDYLNTDGRSIVGRTVCYSLEDSQSSSSMAAYQAAMLAARGIQLFVGTYSDMAVSAVGGMLSLGQMPLVSPLSVSSTVISPFYYPSVLLAAPNSITLVPLVGSLALVADSNLASFLFSGDLFGIEGISAYGLSRRIFGDDFGSRVFNACDTFINVPFTHDDEKLATYIECSVANNVRNIVLWMSAGSAAVAIEAFYARHPQLTFMFVAPYGWLNMSVDQSITLRNVPDTYVAGSVALLVKTFDTTGFVSWFCRQTPQTANYSAFVAYWESQFRCVYIAATDVPLCPPDVSLRTFECTCDGTERIRPDMFTPNEYVNYVFDSVLAYGMALYRLTNDCGQLPFRLGDMCGRDSYSAGDIRETVRQSAFIGETGIFAFQGNVRLLTEFTVLMLDAQNEPVFVGSANVTGTTLVPSLFPHALLQSRVFVDQTTFYAENTGFPLFVFVLCICMFVVLALSWLYFETNRDNKVVVRANINFLRIVCWSLFIVLLCMFLWTMPQSDAMCDIKLFAGVVGMSLLIGAVFAKVLHNWQIHTGRAENMDISTAKLVIVTVAVSLPTVAMFLVVCFVGMPPFGFDNVVAVSNDVLYQYAFCAPNDAGLLNAMLIPMYVVNGLVLFFCVCVGMSTRHDRAPFNEQLFLWYAAANLLINGVLFVIVYYTIPDENTSSQTKFLTRSLFTAFAVAFTYGFLLLPKMLAMSGSFLYRVDDEDLKDTDIDKGGMQQRRPSYRPKMHRLTKTGSRASVSDPAPVRARPLRALFWRIRSGIGSDTSSASCETREVHDVL